MEGIDSCQRKGMGMIIKLYFLALISICKAILDGR
jgi:hypothetical protein